MNRSQMDSMSAALQHLMRNELGDAVQLRFMASPDRDVTTMMMTSQFYVQRQIDGLTFSQVSKTPTQTAAAFEAWIKADLRTLAYHLEDVADKIRTFTNES
jgi:hypothetical protein